MSMAARRSHCWCKLPARARQTIVAGRSTAGMFQNCHQEVGGGGRLVFPFSRCHCVYTHTWTIRNEMLHDNCSTRARFNCVENFAPPPYSTHTLE